MSVTIVIPCLNEEGSIEECVNRVKKAFEHEKQLEILVADNGSTDNSKTLAEKAGATVVEERRRGYGSAILRGLREAKGEFILIGDADNTYDYRDGAALVNELQKGAEFAIGDRIHGEVEAGAMPWLHQHIGTPILTGVLNQFFGSRVHDINCGLRAIRKDCLEKIRLRSPGMEFASEMVIHAQKAGLKFAELPIRYYRRHHGQAKLRTFRDGWRHLRFILLCAPYPLFILPAIAAIAASGFLYSSPRLGYQVLGSLTNLIAFQLIVFAFLAKASLWVADSFIVDHKFGLLMHRYRLEYGILTSFVFLVAGVVLFSAIDLVSLIRGATLIALGVQTLFSSFLLSTILFKKGEGVL